MRRSASSLRCVHNGAAAVLHCSRVRGVRAHLSCAELARDELSRRLESRQQRPVEQR